VRGYPSVVYGLDQCHAATSAPESARLPLPAQVAALHSSLVGTTSYRIRAPSSTYDLAYDLWLNPSATREPCLTDGTIEIMVWLDYDQQALGTSLTSVTVPFAVDGHAQRGADMWWLSADNIGTDGSTSPWGGTLWFVLKRPHVVERGTVSVDLSAVLAAAGSFLQQNYGWQGFEQHYWLDTVPFGIEFGPQNASPSAADPVRFSLALHSYCLDEDATIADASC